MWLLLRIGDQRPGDTGGGGGAEGVARLVDGGNLEVMCSSVELSDSNKYQEMLECWRWRRIGTADG